MRILVCDDEGNIHPADYEFDPWSGLGYQLAHTTADAFGDCPIATEDDYEATLGFCIYNSREKLLLYGMKEYSHEIELLSYREE